MTDEPIQTRWMRLFASLVWIAIIQVFAISLMSASPELHECCHSGSHESGHQCLATDFQAGTVDQLVVIPLVFTGIQPFTIWNVVIPVAAAQALPLHLCGSLLEHGPPVFA